MRRSQSPASSCCTAFGRDSSNCDLSAFKVELHLQSGTRCFRPELCAPKQECLLVLAICTRALALTEASTDLKTRLRAASGQHWCAAAVRLQHGIERRMMRCRHAESASLPHHMAREAFYFERTSSGEIVVHRGVHARREAL